jgi:signal transduction histidine kinase
MAKFTVDTHLFRELGELLVGRDSTALVELIKNSYDADAKHVTVHGENLDKPGIGKIVITDNGSGMTKDQFEAGFLRIASRLKDRGDRRSDYYGRRFTGAKGVGRLAAHKLARYLSLESVPRDQNEEAITATIDWNKIEAEETLETVASTDAVIVSNRKRAGAEKHSTTIELTKLRRKWTPGERTRLFWEVGSFRPPAVLTQPTDAICDEKPILETIEVSDVRKPDEGKFDPGFGVELTGDFAAGEDYWQMVAEAANWIIEIDAKQGAQKVRFNILPTKRCQRELRTEGLEVPERQIFTLDHPDAVEGPFFQARILVREGALKKSREQKGWVGLQGGVRFYMEGFRVLPYGEPSDDWLEIDADYTRRDRTLRFLDVIDDRPSDEEEGLLQVRKLNYFGGVFMMQKNAGGLRMLVNREGFVPDASYDRVKKLVRVGIDLSVRRRAAVRLPLREQRREERETSAMEKGVANKQKELKEAVEEAVSRAAKLATEARSVAAAGDVRKASSLIESAAKEFREGSELSERLLTERSIMRILSGVGLQMASFVHEINGLLGMAGAIERACERLQSDNSLSRDARKAVGSVRKSIGDLRRVVERQASYLTDITAPDSRRRRARLRLRDRFEAAARLVGPAIERREITVDQDIDEDIKTPPMFPAEMTVVFSNLLTNAVKAAGRGGKIAASAVRSTNGEVVFRIENTGVEVKLAEGERWFRPFETTTAKTDPVLGQGMGMGLPITRNMLEEYGATIAFAKPSRGFATAVEIRFPGAFE